MTLKVNIKTKFFDKLIIINNDQNELLYNKVSMTVITVPTRLTRQAAISS